MFALEGADHFDAFGTGEVEDVDAFGFQSFHAALRVDAVADDYLPEAELRDEAGAIAAGRERGDEDQVGVAGLTAGGAEGVGFSVHGGVAVLHEAIATGAEQRAVEFEDGAADGDAAFGKADAGLFDGHFEHGVGIWRDLRSGNHFRSVALAKCLTQQSA